MCRVIAVSNQKGGVGKTVSCVNLGIGLAQSGKKVLLIDADPQGSLTISLGYPEPDQMEYSLATAMMKIINDEQVDAKQGILHHEEGVDILPGNIELSGLEISLIGVISRETILREFISYARESYDYIIIDCMPSLGMLTINSMTAADTVLVPIQCEFFALDGLSQLIYTINLIKKKLNKSLEIEGVVFTMYDARTNLSLEVVENVKNNLDQFIYKTIIPRNVRLAEAPSFGLPINLYDSRSSGAQGYRDLADEVINNKLYAKL